MSAATLTPRPERNIAVDAVLPVVSPMPRAPDLTGRTLQGRYELHALIGEGAFGHVYRGRDRRLARDVAVKVIKPWWAEDPVWVERFARETQLLAQVNDPGIVQIYDVGEAEEGPFYVAELVDGESLADLMRSGPLSFAQATAVCSQLCRALGRAHARGIVHLDVKPANILLADDGGLKVGDFGVARLTQADRDRSTVVMGTPQYMSPEQAAGGPTTPASDVYAAGVVLYEMLSGEPPFNGETAVLVAMSHLRDEPPPLSEEVPAQLRSVCARAMSKDPAARFADGLAMAEALEAVRLPEPALVAAGAPPADARPTRPLDGASTVVVHHATRVAPPRRPPAPPARRRGRLLAAVFLIVAVAGAALLALRLVFPAQVTVPRLVGLRRDAIDSALGQAHLSAVFNARFDGSAARGVAVAQRPAAGLSVGEDSAVAVTISDGPPPVSVPRVIGLAVAGAGARLSAAGLHDTVVTVPAPGVGAGTVTAQRPAGGASAAAGSSVTLQVAEAPIWRTLTTFSGVDDGASVPFRILGSNWRVVTNMSYVGTCTLIVACFGPHVSVSQLGSGPGVSGFDLAEGAGTQTFGSGPGTYQLHVSGGMDSANWTITVQDHY
jgi:serine/threonine-protein kinase